MGSKLFKDKFIAFVDILGFESMVERAEANDGLSLSDLREFCDKLGRPEDSAQIVERGPMTCPDSAYICRDLDFQVAQVSDCVVVSAEVSPAGVINLIAHCWSAAMGLLTKGVMVRGFVTRGAIFHDGTEFMGSGYQRAFHKESDVTAFRQEADERGTPFIEVDSVVCDYVRDSGDACVSEMFSVMAKGDETVTAIYPFQRLSHSFVVAAPWYKFDPEKERESNQVMRGWIQSFKERVRSFVDESKPDVVRKADHYIRALDAQLVICDRIDRHIDRMGAPYPAQRMRDLMRP